MKHKGFTLLEILLVIAAIGILAAIVIVAINPQRQLALTRNAERESGMRTIEQSLEQFLIDQGSYPVGVNNVYQEVCATDAVDCTGLLDLSVLTPNYMARIPVDPQSDTPNGTGYQVAQNPDNGRISLRNMNAELDQDIALNEFLVCPTGYIVVPGNAEYGTSDFCVMQFEAKSGVVSTASGAPIANITQSTAISQCNDPGSGRRLMNNNEWMTIARNIESQPENWISGQVGVGGLYRGFTPGTSSNPIEVANESDPYTGTSGSPEQRRTMQLSNGRIIWDMTGNAEHFLIDTVTGGNKPVPSVTTQPVEWSSISNFGSLGAVGVAPSNAIWDSTQNVGQYISGGLTGSGYAFIRGGSRSDTDEAGIYSLYLQYLSFIPAKVTSGFRCVMIPTS